jgi:phospholipid-binding lipoprotein MlaA
LILAFCLALVLPISVLSPAAGGNWYSDTNSEELIAEANLYASSQAGERGAPAYGRRSERRSLNASPLQIAQLKAIPGMAVKADGFGGHLFSYTDKWGNKHTSNSAQYMLNRLPASASAGNRLNQGGNIRVAELRTVAGPVRVARVGQDKAGSVKQGQPAEPIYDPLEPVNRAFFHFNDKLYFWVMKPLAKGYSKVVPEPLRVCVSNFFSNLCMPVRAINCLLQGKFKGFGTEITRFVVNTTMGVAGFGDAAKIVFDLEGRDEDLGQTLGFYGMGPGIYINWPILGPSSLRDTFGLVGDGLLTSTAYVVDATKYNVMLRGYEGVNDVSLELGDYESLKKSALDPYISLRNVYHQSRRYKIAE